MSEITINIKLDILVKNVGGMPCRVNMTFPKPWDEMTAALNFRNR
jgi:hypothetical protein